MRRNRTFSMHRSRKGASLVELSISSVVMAFVSMAVFGLLITTMAAGNKINNTSDTIDVSRTALERISQNVRTGRSLGDVFGSLVGGRIQGSSVFPSNQNPIYGAGQSPPNGWPIWADGRSLSSFVVDSQTLVVQVPIFDPNGFPTAIPPFTGQPATSQVQDNVETHVYRVIPDPQNNGEWIMQWARFPGMAAEGYVPAAAQSQPQTICTGIIGPLQNGLPCVFQYLDKTDPSGTPQNNIPNGGTDIAAFSGLIVNLELSHHQNSSQIAGRYKQPGVLALKTEVFLRNNSLATTVGMPSTAVAP
ncbi:MAG: hypothetical protein K2W95_16240 [Candidatus Obscuribacterales bacterium]|nr:hypothetical protein [Candidatus Obscuribacterales bacterium]